MKHLFTHAHIISPGIDIPDGGILVSDGRIEKVFSDSASMENVQCGCVTDLGGRLVMPGFFDIHFHGCAGADMADGTAEALRTVAAHKLEQGVTAFLGTTLTLAEETLLDIAVECRKYQQAPTGADLLGMHLEGPFIAPECAGAQNPAFLKKPDMDLVRRIDEECRVLKVSYSPELDPDMSFIAELTAAGIMPSAAHSAADYDLFCRAADLGMKHITHFCNCITPLHHLRPGMVGGGLFREDIFLEIICDGIHLHPDMVKFIFRTAGSDRIMLITDSMRGAGMPDGEYTLGGLPVVVRDGCARVKETNVVAGSTLLYHQALKNVAKWTGMPLHELIAATSYNQARSLGIEDLGRIAPGFRADLTVTDEDLVPVSVWVRGEEKWSKK